MFSRCETCPICINMWSKSEFAQKKIERKKKLCGKLRVLNGLFIGTPNKNTQWIWQLKQIRFITLFFLSLFTSFIHFLLSRRFIGIEIRLRFCLFEHHTHTHGRIIGFESIFLYLSELAELGGSNFGCCCNSFFTDADIFDQLNDEKRWKINNDTTSMTSKTTTTTTATTMRPTYGSIMCHSASFSRLPSRSLLLYLTTIVVVHVHVCVSTTSCVIFLLRRINSNANAVVVFKKPFPCVGLGTHVYLRWVLTVKQKCVEHEHEQLIGTHAYTCDCNLVNAIWMNVAKYLAISKTYAT